MTSISGTICNFDIEAIGIDIVIGILRYRRTPILKKRRYRRFVLRYRRSPILKKRRYRRFNFDIGVARYRRFFDIDVQKHTDIDVLRFDIDVLIDSSGPGSCTGREADHDCTGSCIYVLVNDCSEGVFTPREGRAAARAASIGPRGPHRPIASRARRWRAPGKQQARRFTARRSSRSACRRRSRVPS
jgi:hypothetical protein